MAFVQSMQGSITNNTVGSFAYTSNTTAGNLLVLAMRVGNDANTIVSIVDTQGNTWLLAKSQILTTSGIAYLYYVPICVGGANTVTITVSISATSRIMLLEYNDFVTSGAILDQVAGAENTGTAISSGNIVTVYDNELLVVTACVIGSKSFTAGAGFTEREEVVNKASVEDGAAVTAGTYAGTMTIGTSDTWACAIASFAVAPSRGPLLSTKRKFLVLS